MRLFPITIDIAELTDEMIEWAKSQGADVWTNTSSEFNIPSHAATKHDVIHIRMPGSKISKLIQRVGGRLHFDNSQKEPALLFLLLYDRQIVKHNMTELNLQENNFYAAT